MKCKFKDPENERTCLAVYCECQFVKGGYGPDCPIFQAYKDLDLPS